MIKIFKIRYEYFYGGILTIDTVGCNINCAFCYTKMVRRERSYINFEEFLKNCEYSNIENIKNRTTWSFENNNEYIEVEPQIISQSLLKFAKKHHFKKIRFSSGEPTYKIREFIDFCKKFNEVRTDEIFILETNGVNLGVKEDYLIKMKDFKTWIYIRLSLKTPNKVKYEKICGSLIQYELSRIAFKNLVDIMEIPFHITFVWDIMDKYDFLEILKISQKYNLINFEYETIYYYPHVMKSIQKQDLENFFYI